MVHAWYELSETDDWPKSYNLYTGKLTFQIAAHSEDQARQRLTQLQTFLEGQVMDPLGDSGFAHDAVRCALSVTGPNSSQDRNPDFDIELIETVEIESLDELRPSMGTDELLEWSWLLPNADADYDPDQAAHEMHNPFPNDAKEDDEADGS